MIDRTVRGALVAVALLAIPVAPARACHLFDRCCGRPTTAYYAPVAQPYVASYAPACCPQPQACCPQQQVVNYMPQTCYRTVYVNTPVVAYSPTTACDACGRTTTVMRPVTTFVAQPRLVAYTTYRPVVTAAGVTATYAPAVSVAPAAPACCSPASATTYSAGPATTYAPAPVTSSAPLQSVTPAPSLSPVPSPQPSQTFETSPSDIDALHSRLLLPPSGDSSNLISRPRGLDPEDQDRTTAIPLRQPSVVRQASLIVPVKSVVPKADNDGWRAARP
jgi:hypothetical protein